ncbi:hypothetical protein [Sphingopyxis macrogoltabida]|uniref:hypothetical protein n=1 Tax=Sphingopyxis macrogoltabida TaxID=33050 RepID=UPI0011AB697B|nr:hypothetical protein [Sphingopyxis macrogoltabida]
MGEVENARAHLDAAIAALSYEEAWRLDPVTGEQCKMDGIEMCIAQDLDRVESQLLPRGLGPTVIGAVSESIRHAFVEIIAARNALGDDHG